MLLKFKNKHMMALDKMIKEANDIGGAMIDSIVLDPNEALGLALEVIQLGSKYIGSVKVTDLDGVDVTARELVWNGSGIDKTAHVKKFVNSWYKLRLKVKYDGIPVSIIKQKPKPKKDGWMGEPKGIAEVTMPAGVKLLENKPDPTVEAPENISITEGWEPPSKLPIPPKPPVGRIIREGSIGECEKCGSSLKEKWFFFKTGGCIQPECEDYWETFRNNEN